MGQQGQRSADCAKVRKEQQGKARFVSVETGWMVPLGMNASPNLQINLQLLNLALRRPILNPRRRKAYLLFSPHASALPWTIFTPLDLASTGFAELRLKKISQL